MSGVGSAASRSTPASIGHDPEPTGRYIAALGLPVLATFALIAIVVATHVGHHG
jgi:hypothetical protein